MNRTAIYIFLFSLCLGACTFSTTRLNDKKDQDQTRQVAESFYKALKTKTYAKTYPFLADTFLKVTDTSKLNRFYKTYEDRMGTIDAVEFLKCETKAVNSNNSTLTAVIFYTVKRSLQTSYERLLLQSVNGEPLKIVRYDIAEKPMVASQGQAKKITPLN
ncbi:hypothetical protein [Pedobacter sp. Hv1]|uniref:hypothetical protein n=1 Tax=Pedobacter sp. Hv1 TaxID=1740090 RepID=UPI0006D8929B|nr:hypothetical protein [Pedobacter sp. Hv1]KQB99975.1 hypothetical protein AQF98_15830 [Pedobacter sp. Hv1]